MAQRLETVSARRAHAAIVCCLVAGAAFAQADGKSALPRTPSGHPDLSGTYDVATLTPLMRPPQYGEKQFLTAE